MIIGIDGVKEYVLVCIALAGEIEEEWMRRRFDGRSSPRHVSNMINELIKDGFIKRTSPAGYFRLRKPNGLEWLKRKNIDLYNNYMMISGGHKFAGSPRRQRRREKNVLLIQHMIERNIPVNFFDLKYETSLGRKKKDTRPVFADFLGISKDASNETRSIFIEGTDTVKKFEEQLTYVSPDDSFFLTGKIIRKEEHGQKGETTSRRTSSRMFGAYVSDLSFFPVYCIDTDFTWNSNLETQTNMILRSSWWRKWGEKKKEEEYKSNLKGSGIFFYTDDGALEEIASKIVNKKVKGFRPWDVFDSAHFIPLRTNPAEELLSVNGYEHKIKSAVFGESANERSFYDAVLGDNPAWELLTNDVVKIRKIKTVESKLKARGKELIFIAYDWQVKMLETIFDEPKIVTINEKETEKIIEQVKGDNT